MYWFYKNVCYENLKMIYFKLYEIVKLFSFFPLIYVKMIVLELKDWKCHIRCLKDFFYWKIKS